MTDIDDRRLEPFVVDLDGLYEVRKIFRADGIRRGKVTDVATAPDGSIFVLCRHDHYETAGGDCIFQLDPEGRVLASWGRGRIADPHKIAVDRSGHVWIVDRDRHEVVAFDADGRELMTLGQRNRPNAPFNHPSDIAFGTDGTICIADGYGGGKIHCFDHLGNLLRSFGSVGYGPGEFLTPHGVAILSNGRILVADRENNRVQMFSPQGEFLQQWRTFLRPSDIWVGDDDSIYVCDAIPTLTKLAPSGEVLGRCRPCSNGPHGISGDGAGAIYLAETNPSRVTRLVPMASRAAGSRWL